MKFHVLFRFFRRSELTGQLWAFRREFLWVGFFSMVTNLLTLTPTIYLLQLYDRVFKSQSELTLLVVTLLMLFLYAIMAFAEWLRSRLLVRGGVRLDEALNSLVFNASFERNLKRSGGYSAKALGDLTTIRQFLTGNGVFAFFDIPWTPIYIAVIFLLHPFLGWLSILFALIQLTVAFGSHWATLRDTEDSSRIAGVSSSYLQGKLRNIEPLHAMGMSASLCRRWEALQDESLSASRVMQSKQQRQQAVSKFIRYTMQSLTLGAGALMVINGRMSPGGMIAANVLMSKALQPLDMVIAIWKPLIQAKEAFLRIEKLLVEFTRPAVASARCWKPLGNVVLEQLVARAEGRREPILHGLEGCFPAGTVTVVLGPSGSGKSTLARCLVGAWPMREGRVLYDGEDDGSWDRESLGPSIGYLPQDIELFEGTIAENIARFGQVDPALVIDAARRAGIHEMALRFPNGYNTQIGEAGGMLSGGQRQRIGLARALYGDPTLVVLDEPNSNLDESGERSLSDAVRELKANGKTVFLVTHRQHILAVADRVVVLNEGRIKYNGPVKVALNVIHGSARGSLGLSTNGTTKQI